MSLKPLYNRVLIQQLEAETTTKSGIILPGQATEQPQIARVIAVGPGKEDKPMSVKVNDQVIFPKYKGTDVKYDGMDYIIIDEEDLLAIVE